MEVNADSRIWIYLSDKELDQDTEKSISVDLYLFLQNWKAHGNPLKTGYEIRDHRFIILSVDEEEFSASGCSIDKQVQFIKELEAKYGLSLLNRLLVAYPEGDKVKVVPSSKIPELLASGAINEGTMI
ncbi:MAG: ABC transporter ATPase, partial [Bacteroidia bacterium]